MPNFMLTALCKLQKPAHEQRSKNKCIFNIWYVKILHDTKYSFARMPSYLCKRVINIYPLAKFVQLNDIVFLRSYSFYFFSDSVADQHKNLKQQKEY